MTAFGMRIVGASRSTISSRLMREETMSGKALTTQASLTMDFVLKLLGRHLHDGDTLMCELVDEFRGTIGHSEILSSEGEGLGVD
jgi:hypothetical protein